MLVFLALLPTLSTMTRGAAGVDVVAAARRSGASRRAAAGVAVAIGAVAGPAPGGLRDNTDPMTDPTPQDVQRYIADGLTCDHLEVEGDGRHFFATIVSAEFEGLMRIRRHQRVYAALGDRMREQIHALSMKTLTPAEWASQRALGSDAASHSH